MTRTRVILATLACVAFLAVSAGPAAADGYAKYCKIQISGIPDACRGTVAVCLPYGTKYGLQNGDYFVAKEGCPIRYAVRVGKFYGPWCDYKVECDTTLDVSSKFCLLKVQGIPEDCPGLVSIYGFDGGLRNGSVVCLPRGVKFRYRASVGDIRGPWCDGATVECNDYLDVSKKFCVLGITGIPADCRGVIDIYGLGSSGVGLTNGVKRCFPNGATIKCRARLHDITGPWDYRKVDCDGDLDAAKKFVNVKWVLAWTQGGRTLFKDAPISIGNGGSHCFPKCAKVYARPDLGDLSPAWDCKVFYEDTCVYWKLYCVTVAAKPAPAPE